MTAPDLPAVLMPDPPWKHGDSLGRRGAAAHYDPMATDAIVAMPIPEMAERNVLVMWTLENMTADAMRVIDAWGYTKLAALTWHKLDPCGTCAATGRVDVWRFGDRSVLVPGTTRDCPKVFRLGDDPPVFGCGGLAGRTHLGMGTTTRGSTEAAWICRPKKGRAPERLDKGVPSIFAAPMLVDLEGELGMLDKRGKLRRGLKAFVHSHKPQAAFDLVARMYPGPRVEMFGRMNRPGWTVLGAEVGKLDKVVATFAGWPARLRAERLAAARER